MLANSTLEGKKMIYKYYLFMFCQYYPRGGWNDLKGSFKTIEEALIYAFQYKNDNDFFQIIDIETRIIVKCNTN